MNETGQEDATPKRPARARPRYREMVEAADAILWETDPSGQQFTFVSPRAESLLGYPVSKWLATPGFWPTIVDPDDRARASALRRAIFAGNGGALEYRARSSEGAPLWLRETVHVSRDRSGAPVSAQGMIVEVTDLKQAEEVALRLSSLLQAAQNEASKVVPLEEQRIDRRADLAAAAESRTLFLADVGRTLPSMRDPRALASQLLMRLVDVFELDLCLLTQIRPEGLQTIASWPPEAAEAHLDCDLVARMEQVDSLVSFPLAALRCTELPSGITALVMLPLQDGEGRRLGALAIGTSRADGLPDQDRLELRWYVNEIGRALAFTLAHEALGAAATIDPATGLLSREALYLRFAQEVERATRLEQPLALLRWELPDAPLHPDATRATDLGARAFAEVLRRELRPYDVVGRIGERDFAALLMVKNHETALTIAGRVQQRTVRTPIRRGRYLQVPARGFALFPEDATDVAGLERVAEVRLANHRETRRSLIGMKIPDRGEEPKAAG